MVYRSLYVALRRVAPRRLPAPLAVPRPWCVGRGLAAPCAAERRRPWGAVRLASLVCRPLRCSPPPPPSGGALGSGVRAQGSAPSAASPGYARVQRRASCQKPQAATRRRRARLNKICVVVQFIRRVLVPRSRWVFSCFVVRCSLPRAVFRVRGSKVPMN